MPDLSNKGSHQFWHDFPDPSVYKIMALMESVENWTLDGSSPKLEATIAELGNAFDDIGNIDLQEEDKFIQTSVCLKMGRSLRLLHCLDSSHPGAASKILMYAEKSAENNKNAELFLRRNIVFERLRLLSRIFSENRLATIIKILGNKG